MVAPYLPVGDRPKYDANGAIIGSLTAGTPTAYTQTYATPADILPAITAAAAALSVAADAPAGGTGANAGGWSSAANRNIAITTVNEIKTLLESLKTEHTALTADILALKKVNTALIDDLQARELAV